MVRGRGDEGPDAGENDNSAIDPSDWLASQFTDADDAAPDAAPPTFAPSWFDQSAGVPPRVTPSAEMPGATASGPPPAAGPPTAVPPASGPPAAAPPAAGATPPPFDWGFGAAATPDEAVSAPSAPPRPTEQPQPLEQPTELLPVADIPPRPAVESRDLGTPTEFLGVAPPRGAAFWDVGSAAPSEATSAMDALPARGSIAPGETVAPSPAGAIGGSRAALTRNQAIIGAVLIAAIVLVLLFLIGTRIPALTGSTAAAVAPTSTPTVTPSPTPTPTPTAVPTGPASVGSHDWKLLRGGECITPFVSPFAETFTVVDCTTAHAAQLVARGTFPPATSDTYPGLAGLQSQMNLLCTTPAVINLATAGAYADIQVQGAYAANADEWASGQHDYFCFVSRSSGEPLMNSVAAG